MHLTGLYRTTVGLSLVGDSIIWVAVHGFRKTIKTLTCGVVDRDEGLDDPDWRRAFAQFGLSANERYVRHTSAIVSGDDEISEEMVDEQFSTFLPDQADTENFHFSWRCSPSGNGSLLSLSTVSRTATQRDVQQVANVSSSIECISSQGQDLPFILVHMDDFVTGASYVISANSEYVVLFEYQNSSLLGSAIFYGSPEEVLPDLEIELVRLNSSNLPQNAITVVGEDADAFITNASVHSIGITYQIFRPLGHENWMSSITCVNAPAAALAIRMFYEGALGFNLIDSSDIGLSQVTRLQRRSRFLRRRSAAATGILIATCLVALILVGAVKRDLDGEIEAVSQQVAAAKSSQISARQSIEMSSDVADVLRRQTNIAQTLHDIGDGESQGSRWTRLHIISDEGKPATISIRGFAESGHSLTTLVASLEAQPFLDDLTVSTNTSTVSSSSSSEISFEINSLLIQRRERLVSNVLQPISHIPEL